MKYAWILLVLFALTASAAGIDGTWKGTMQTPNGSSENTFEFKTDGGNVTGTVTGQMGQAPIANGKLEGDVLTFNVVRNFNGNEFKLLYKGKVKDDQIQMSITVEGRDLTFDMTLKKQ